MTLIEDLKALEASALAGVLDDITSPVEISVLDGCFHPGWGSCGQSGKGALQVTYEVLTLTQIRERLCLKCARRSNSASLGLEFSSVLQASKKRGRVLHLARVDDANARALGARRGELVEILAEAEEARAGGGHPLVVQEASDVAELAAAGLATVGAALRAQLDQVLASVRQVLVGDPGVALDETPVLVGVHPVPAAGRSLLRALVDVSAVRLDDVAVLRVPAYARDFVMGEQSRTSAQGAPVGSSATVDDTAALLWDPTSTGPTRSLVTCVAAGEAL